MTMKKNAELSDVDALVEKSKDGTVPVPEIGADKSNRSGAPSLRYPSGDSGTNTDNGKSQQQIEDEEKAAKEAAEKVKAKQEAEQKAKDEAAEKLKQQQESEAKAKAEQEAIEAESKKDMQVDSDTKLTDTSSDASKKEAQATVVDTDKDSDGVSHYDGTNNTGAVFQYNGALNSALVAQETESGVLYNRFKYRASDTYSTYANGNISPPFGGSRLAENEAQPYHVMTIDNYEFGLGVVDNAGGSQKDSTTVKLAQTQPDGSVSITLGLPNSAQSVTPSLWFALSLADLSNKEQFDVQKFTDAYVIGFELIGDGTVTSKFIGEFAYNPNWITLATNMAGKNSKKVYNAAALSPAVKNVSRPFQGYVGILESKENIAKVFPNNASVYWPEASYPYSKNSKYAMPYGKFTVKMYATRRTTGETYEMSFPLTVNFNPKAS